MCKTIQSGKNRNWQYIVVAVFFLLLLVYGLMVFKDYGISTDEFYQRNHSLGAYKNLVPSVSEIVTDTVNFPKVSASAYGVLIQLPTIVVEHVKNFALSYRQIYLIRHLYTFLVFYVSMFFFYLMCCRLTKNKLLALMGPIMMILSPRLFAESFYNIKDVMCMSLMVVSLYFGLRFLDRPNIWRLLILGIAVILCADSRIIGIVVFPAAIFVMLMKGWSNGTWKRQLAYLAAALAAGLAVSWIFLGKSPWDLFLLVWKKVKYFSNYAGWEGTNYYFGQYYEAGTNPRHYIPVWIAITTPLAYLFFWLAGTVESVRKIKKSQGYDQCFLLICMGAPIAYILIMNPVLYNGWRHFYFIYPEILLLAFYGFVTCLEKATAWEKKQKNGTVTTKKWGMNLVKFIPGAVMATSMLFTVLWMVRNHPYEYVYFNMWSQSYAHENFNKDYWHVSEDQAIREIIWQETAPVIKVSTLMSNHLYLLSPEERARVEWLPLEKADQADYMVVCYTESPDRQKFAYGDMYEEIQSVKVDGHKINSTFRRIYDVAAQSMLRIQPADGKAAFDTNAQIRWTGDVNGGGLTGELAQSVESQRIHLDVNEEFPVEALSVSVSADGETWIQMSSMQYSSYGITVDYPVDSVRYVRLCWDSQAADQNAVWEVQLQVFCRRGESVIDRHKVVASVKASHQPWETVKAIDGSLETRWTSGASQVQGMWLTVVFRGTERISAMILDSSVSQWDSPVMLEFFGTLDGEEWHRIPVESRNGYTFYFETPQECSQIRMEIGALTEEVPYNWSIDELHAMWPVEEP